MACCHSLGGAFAPFRCGFPALSNMSGVEPPRAAFYGALKQQMDPFMAETRRRVRILGLGNIGFRHLQGFAPMADRIQLQGRDPSAEAAERAQTEWSATLGSQGDFGPAGTGDGPADLVVIATSAIGREALLREQLDQGVRSVLLEKIVFTGPAPFGRAQALLDENGAVAFVNTARRLWPLHRRLTALRAEMDTPVAIQVSGRNIGLACNGVHFIDLLQMISGEADVRLKEADLSQPWASKREGYYEVWGQARFETPGGSSLELAVQPDGPERHEITMTLGRRVLTVDEFSGVVTEDGRPVSDDRRFPFQSELSVLYAEPMLSGRAPDLPTLAESALAHAALFDLLTPAFSEAGLMTDRGLPIT